MARISDSCESRFRQNFRQSFDWLEFNAQFTEHMREQRTAIAIDPSYISKAGKTTPVVMQGLDVLGFDLISRLHDNAKMKCMYTGPQKARGRHRKFAERVDLDNLREDIFTTENFVDEGGEGVVLHTGEVWVDCLDRICKVVVADYLDPDKKTQTRKVYFATDRSLSGRDIFDLYRTRFQIEFLYRDGKHHMGLTHCQARSEEALDFSYNMSLSSINVLRKFARDNDYGNLSIGSMKMLMHNAFMLDRFISITGKSPKLRKNDTVFKELLFLGVRDAA